MKIKVSLSTLVRMEKVVNVEVPDDFESWSDFQKKHLMNNLYETTPQEDFSIDNSWGCEEGTHCILGSYEEPEPVQYKANKDCLVEDLG